MTTWVGVDPSTRKVALVAFDGDKVSMSAVILGGSGRDPGICYRAWQGTTEFCESLRDRSLIVAVESPIMHHRNVQTAIAIAKVVGAVLTAFWPWSQQVILAQPASWKQTLGDAHASKQRVRELLAARWPSAARHAGSDQDLVDAAGLCYHALHG